MKNAKQLPADRFIALWRSAPTLTAFCEKTGMDRGVASSRAARYRARGVDLKRFPTGGYNKLDIPKLNRIARESLRKYEAQQRAAKGS